MSKYRNEVYEFFNKCMQRKPTEEESKKIAEFQISINMYHKLQNDLDDGNLLKQGEIPGSINGYICHICSDVDACRVCKYCGHYFCNDHIVDTEECEGCGK